MQAEEEGAGKAPTEPQKLNISPGALWVHGRRSRIKTVQKKTNKMAEPLKDKREKKSNELRVIEGRR